MIRSNWKNVLGTSHVLVAGGSSIWYVASPRDDSLAAVTYPQPADVQASTDNSVPVNTQNQATPAAAGLPDDSSTATP